MPIKQRKSVRRRIRWRKANSFLNFVVFLLGIIGIVLIILFIHYPAPKEYPTDWFENHTFSDTIITIDGEDITESGQSEIPTSSGSETEETISASKNMDISGKENEKPGFKEEFQTFNRTVYEFYIIAGSFKNQGNADLLQKQLVSEGYASSVIETQNNLFRVSMGGFRNEGEAKDAFNQIKKGKYKDIWILEVH